MRVLVCGGLNLIDREKIRLELDTLHRLSPISCLLYCTDPEADSMASEWAKEAGVSIEEFGAALDVAAMIDIGRPDLVLAFSGSRTVAAMVKQARATGVRVQLVG